MGSAISLFPFAARHICFQITLEELKDDRQYPVESGGNDKGFDIPEILAPDLSRPEG